MVFFQIFQGSSIVAHPLYIAYLYCSRQFLSTRFSFDCPRTYTCVRKDFHQAASNRSGLSPSRILRIPIISTFHKTGMLPIFSKLEKTSLNHFSLRRNGSSSRVVTPAGSSRAPPTPCPTFPLFPTPAFWLGCDHDESIEHLRPFWKVQERTGSDCPQFP